MLKFFLAFYFSTYHFSVARDKQNVVRDKQFNRTHLRVIQGRDIENSKYQFVVVLFIFDENCTQDFCRVCTASMITESWVITAAHCVNILKGVQSFIWYGNYTVPPYESKLYTLVLEIIVHPGFRIVNVEYLNAFIVDNDISLLRVHSISLQRYGRLSSVDHTTFIGLPVTYVGGGVTDKLGDDDTRLLQLGEAAVVTCDEEFRDLTRYLICIAPKCSNKLDSPNSGDSGGPLMYNGRIIGVLSYGQDVDTLTSNGYAPVSPYIDWIHEVMRPK